MRRLLYGLGIIVALLFAWYMLHKRDVKRDAQTVSQTLPTDDKAKVIVDDKRHTVTTITKRADGVLEQSVQFLAPRVSIETKPDGAVVVTSRSFGTEFSPWMGVSFDTEKRARTTLGLNAFYVKRWEFGGGLSVRTSDLDPRAFMDISLNVYSNTLLYAAIDNHKAVSAGLALKF